MHAMGKKASGGKPRSGGRMWPMVSFDPSAIKIDGPSAVHGRQLWEEEAEQEASPGRGEMS